MSRTPFSAPVDLGAGFEVPLVGSLQVTPVGSAVPSVRLCRGVSVRVVRISPSGEVLGLLHGGRRYSVPAAALRAVSPVGALEAAPARAPRPSVGGTAAPSDPGFWEPRRRVGGAADAPLYAAPAPRRRASSAGRPTDAVRANLDAHVRRARGLS